MHQVQPLIITHFLFLFYLSQIALSANQESDWRLENWCTRHGTQQIDACMPELMSWCGEKIGRQVNNTLCRKYSKPTKKLESDFKSVARDEGGRRPEKADLSQLNRVKQMMNKFGTNFIKTAVRQLANPVFNALKQADPEAAPTYTEVTINDPEKYFQADIDLTKLQAEEIIRSLLSFINGRRKKRKVGKLPNYNRWKEMPISYEFHSSIKEETKTAIRKAIKLWESNTCVRFMEDGGNIDRIQFKDGGGCSSYVGKAGGTQEITLNQPGCIFNGIIAHEIGHSLGFFHEQNRPDQKQNIDVNYDTLNPLRYNNFMAQEWRDVNTYDLPYDFGSVMHYDPRVKSFQLIPFLATEYVILAKDKQFQNTMGQRKEPSFIDYEQVNRAYCRNSCTSSNVRCLHQGYPDPNNCGICKCPSGLGGKLCDSVAPSIGSCGGMLEAASRRQRIASPNYPRSYPRGNKCNWVITSPPGSKVFVEFTDRFGFKCKDTCDESYVEIKTGPEFQQTGYRLCCNKPTKTFESGGNKFVIILSAMGPTGTGFQVDYWTDADVEGPSVTRRPPTSPPRTRPPPKTIPRTRKPAPPGPQPTKPPLIPSTFAPGQDCYCEAWSRWSSCDYDCGGCGYVYRDRYCENQPENCHPQEKKHCNMKICPGANGPAFRKGKFQFFFNGCCVGLVPNKGRCNSWQHAIGDGIEKVFNKFINQIGSSGKK